AAMRVTRETAAMPPCPAARASAAAKIRRCRSSNRGDIAAWRASSFRKESSSIIAYDTTTHPQGESGLPVFTPIRFTYSLTGPYHQQLAELESAKDSVDYDEHEYLRKKALVA